MARQRAVVDKQAIYDLADQGMKPSQIAAQLGYSRTIVYMRLAERTEGSPAETWSPERLEKLERIHTAAMGVIAEAFGVSLTELRRGITLINKSTRTVPSSDKPLEGQAKQKGTSGSEVRAEDSSAPLQRSSGADVPPPDSLLAKPGNSRPADVPHAASAPARTYRLQALNGQYLATDRKTFVIDAEEAWTGTAAEVKRTREKFAAANYCKMREVR